MIRGWKTSLLELNMQHWALHTHPPSLALNMCRPKFIHAFMVERF